MEKSNTVKKTKNKKIVWLLALLVAIFLIMARIVYGYASNNRYTHNSDEIDMYKNSVTYYYADNEEENDSQKTYTIADDWLSEMLIRKQTLSNDWDESDDSVATNTTIYGPYTWLPAGDYTITFDLTDAGGSAFQYWDVATNFSLNSLGMKKWYHSDFDDIGNGTQVYDTNYYRDESGTPHLTYKVHTDGNSADYEFRLFFSDNLGHDELDDYGTGDMNTKRDFLTSVRIEAINPNNVIYWLDGGILNGSTNDGTTLTTTYWGQSRGNVTVPEKEGYEFLGWYGYRYAANQGSTRETLTFGVDNKNNPELVKLWNADGTPVISSEVSYYDYPVIAKWKIKSYNLTFNPNGGQLKYPGSNINNPNGNTSDHVTVTYSKGDYSDMSADIPYMEGQTFVGWYLYHNDNGNQWWEQIYDKNGLAVKQDTSCFWYWNGNYVWHYDGDVTLYAAYEVNQYSLKLDANYYSTWFDKLKGDGYDLGSVDLYINGKLEAENIIDWGGDTDATRKTYPDGSTYEFKNLKSKNGYVLSDAGSLKGIIKGDTTATVYVYDKAGLAYFDKNSAKGGMGNDRYVFYSMVSLVYNKGAVLGNDFTGFTNSNKNFRYWQTEQNNYYNGGEVMPVNDNYQAKAYIQSASSNLVMDIAWGGISNDSGLNIQLANAWGGCGEYWSFIHADGDDYFVVNSALGKYVTADIANMNVHYCNLDWSSNQLWTLSVAGDGCYYITSKANNNFRITAQGTTSNSNIGLGWKSDSNTNQKWKILFNNRDSIFTAQWVSSDISQNKVNVTLIARYEGVESGTYAKQETVISNKQYTTGDPITWVREKDVNDKVYGDVSFSKLATSETNQIYYVTVPRKTYTVSLDKGTGISAVSGNGTYRYGKKISISASTATGYNFDKWTKEDGSTLSDNNTVSSIEVTDNVRYTANATIKSFPVTVNVRYQDENGNWGSYEQVISKMYNYGETVTYRRVEDDTYNEVNYVEEVTGDITKYIDIERKKYTQIVKVRFENADGSFTDYSEEAKEDKYYGSKFSWSRNADTIYKAASVAEYTVTGNKTNEITLYRNVYFITVSGDSHVIKTSGSGSYRYGVIVTISADSFSEGYHFKNWNDGNTNARRTINVTGNATYIASSEPNADTKYKVEHYLMNLDGSYTIKDIENLIGTSDTKLSTLNIPSKYYEGFTFDNSKTEKNSDVINSDGSTVIRYYYTRNYYSLTVNAGTGIDSVSVLMSANMKDIQSTVKKKVISVPYGASVVINADVSAGYTWSKWYGTYTQWNKSCSFFMPASNVNMTASATANKYTVRLHANKPVTNNILVNKLSDNEWEYDNSNSCYTSTFIYDMDKNIPSPLETYSISGYTGEGWYTAAIGGNNISYGNKKWNLTVNNNGVVDLYAHWNENTYKINFNYNKPSNASGEIQNDQIKEKEVKYNNLVGTLPAPTLIGWSFDGWYTSPNGGTKYNADTKYSNTGDTTVYAHWTANKYNIVFDSNKPSNTTNFVTGNMSNITCTYDTPVIIPGNSYQIRGWDFVGFNTKADGSGDNIIPASTVINLTSVNNGVVILYAQWDAHIEWNASLSKINNDSINALDLTNDDRAVNWEHGLGYGKVMHNTLTYTEFGDMQGFLNVEINNVVPTKIKYEFSDTRINSIKLSNDKHTNIGIKNGKAVYLYNVSSATSSGYLHKISFNIPDYEAEFDVNKEKEYSAYVDISVSYNVRNTGNEITETRRVYYNLEELDMSKVHSRIRRQPGQANN